MRKSFSQRLQELLDPLLTTQSGPILFIIGIILFALLSNGLYDLLLSWLGAARWVVGFAVVGFIATLAFYYVWRRRFGPRIVVWQLVHPQPGLIALVSHGPADETPAAVAIRFHYKGEDGSRETPTLRHCWLLASPGSATDNAEVLKKKYSTPELQIEVVKIDDVDPHQVFDAVNRVYQAARELPSPLSEGDIVADLTGGSKPMTVGVALACATSGRRLQYLQARQHDDTGRAVKESGSDPIAVRLDFERLSKENRRDSLRNGQVAN